MPKVDPYDTQEFYELMQAYRFAQMVSQTAVVAAFEAVKTYIRANTGAATYAQGYTDGYADSSANRAAKVAAPKVQPDAWMYEERHGRHSDVWETRTDTAEPVPSHMVRNIRPLVFLK